jgi:hypothetical protein
MTPSWILLDGPGMLADHALPQVEGCAFGRHLQRESCLASAHMKPELVHMQHEFLE